jgi:4-aminobutyrate--pyruvate transaminase
LIHPYANLAMLRESGLLVLERGMGVFVYDTNSKLYIEGMSGLWCTALDYGNEELAEASAARMRQLSFAHLFSAKSHDPAVKLAERLRETARRRPPRSSSAISGSAANDTLFDRLDRALDRWLHWVRRERLQEPLLVGATKGAESTRSSEQVRMI